MCLCFALLFCAGVLGAGCGGGGKSASLDTGTFVGGIHGTNAYAAVVAGSRTAVAFVTDTRRGVGEPFGGTRRDNSVRLKSKKGPRIALELTGSGARGTLVVGRKRYKVSLAPARRGAGLYRSAGTVARSPVWAVWVVLNNGKQKGTASNGKRVTEPPKIDTKTQTIVRLKKKGKRQKVAKVEPDQGMGAGRTSPAARGIFKGGNGFQGGQGGMGGFNSFGGGGGQFNFGGGGGQFQGGGGGQFQGGGGGGQFQGGGGGQFQGGGGGGQFQGGGGGGQFQGGGGFQGGVPSQGGFGGGQFQGGGGGGQFQGGFGGGAFGGTIRH
jgi:hypothetical protein